MVDAAALGDRIEERKDLGAGDEAVFAYWQAQEAIAEKEERTWIKRARNIVKRYRDDRGDSITFTGEGKHQFNVLWSNVQTLLPTLYARTPKPDVERRFKDEDPVGRLASTLLERCLSYSLDAGDFDSVMKAVVQDRLLPGRGVARVLYVPTFGDKMPAQGEEAESAEDDDAEAQGSDIDSEGDEDEPDDEGAEKKETAEPLREVTYEEARAEYVFWEDYREGPARQWCEVPWVRYQSYLTRDALIKRFGKTKGAKVQLDFTPKGMSGDPEKDAPPPDLYKKAIVREYWDKSKKQAVWIAPGTPDLVLDTQDDPLKLQDFFPNPDPLLSTTTNEKRIPVPDYVEYQDQARELDNLTARIDKLTAALQVKGVYPGENKQVLQQLFDGGDNTLVPVEDWMAFADKGGLEKMILWVPIKQIAETLIQLYNARDRVKALLYEITGLSDILRGETNPNETFGAQELKANFATRRITPQQKDVAKFARDLLRLLGGVIAEHFSAKTISMITGYPQLDPVPQLPPRPQAPPQLMMQQLASPPAVNGGGSPQAPQPGGPPSPPMGSPQSAPMGSTQGPMGSPQGAAPPPPPDPAIQAYQAQMAQWQQALQRVQAIVAKNQQKQQAFDKAVALIKSDGMHGFRIDIEADSTIAPDEQQEKQSRVEFMQQFIPFLGQIIPFCQGNPAMAALGREMTLFTVRAFRVARPLEESIGKAFDAFAKMPPNPKATGQDNKAPAQQGADPHEVALRAHEIATNAQTDQAALQVKAAADQANVQAKVATAASSDNAKVTINRENNAVKVQLAGEQERTEMIKLGETQRQHAVDTELEAQRIADAHTAHMAAEQNKSAGRLT